MIDSVSSGRALGEQVPPVEGESVVASVNRSAFTACFDRGCAGCDECCDFEADPDTCPQCEGDGRDKWNDYILPCPLCDGAGRG